MQKIKKQKIIMQSKKYFQTSNIKMEKNNELKKLALKTVRVII